MYMYNVSVQVPKNIVAEWIRYMQNGHMEAVLNTGCFHSAVLSKVISNQQEEEDSHETYLAQYAFETMDQYNRYQSHFAKTLQADHVKRFGNSCLAFRTLIETLWNKKSR